MHMTEAQKTLFLRYCPRILKDKAEPFPVRYIGCTAFSAPERSASFPKWFVDPKREGAVMILEYAIYYDYDIQHLYDLEHIWVAVDGEGNVVDCWCSFHGMRLRAACMGSFTLDRDHPVLYSQPGKHAMLPHPELFLLHPDFERACSEAAGGGLLVPGFLSDRIQTDSQTDEKVARYIRQNFSFTPTMEFVPEQIREDQLLSCEELLDKIPELIERQLQQLG